VAKNETLDRFREVWPLKPPSLLIAVGSAEGIQICLYLVVVVQPYCVPR
jgi:hypothetical protein